jgi:nicotinate-nucleotide adenylyltransferase
VPDDRQSAGGPAVGILGGTFDPVHNAHLAMARTALRELRLDRVLWLPTGNPKYRRRPVADAEHRVEMLRLATQGERRYAVDTRELSDKASGYTVHTLRELRAELGGAAELYLLLGADQYSKFDTWREPDEVARLAHLAVFARPGFELTGDRAQVLEMTPLAVSASDIRKRVKRGKDISGMVPAPVANYIHRRRLYL